MRLPFGRLGWLLIGCFWGSIFGLSAAVPSVVKIALESLMIMSVRKPWDMSVSAV